jgi:hypothetical protein
MAVPRYLTGDAAGIKEFLDKFDVRLPNISRIPQSMNLI